MPAIFEDHNFGVRDPNAVASLASVSELYLDTFEVTVARYRAFIADYDRWRGEAHPSVGEGTHPRIAGSGWQAHLAEIDQPAELPEYVATRRQIEDFEQQLSGMPALIEAKLKDRLMLLRGVDLAGEIEQVKLRAAQAGREAFERDEAAQKQAAEDFAAMPR